MCFSALLLGACSGKHAQGETASDPSEQNVDFLPLDELQGVWLDADSRSAFLWVKDNSAQFAEISSVAVPVRMSKDSLWLGSESYLIEYRSAYRMSLQNHMGNSISLAKAENEEDTVMFKMVAVEPVAYEEKTTRDSVFFCGERRLHSYITVNPTQRKVYYDSYNTEGIAVSHFSYDNIIHLSVFDGKKCLFRRNFEKSDFADYVPEIFLAHATLLDVVFGSATKDCVTFQAHVCICDGAAGYVIEIRVALDGTYTMELCEY